MTRSQLTKYGNVIPATQIKGTKPGRKVLFDGHMDTVPADNKEVWSHDPFVPVVQARQIIWKSKLSYMKGCGGIFLRSSIFPGRPRKEFCRESRYSRCGSRGMLRGRSGQKYQ